MGVHISHGLCQPHKKNQPIQTMIDPFILPKKYEIVLVLVFKINPKESVLEKKVFEYS